MGGESPQRGRVNAGEMQCRKCPHSLYPRLSVPNSNTFSVIGVGFCSLESEGSTALDILAVSLNNLRNELEG